MAIPLTGDSTGGESSSLEGKRPEYIPEDGRDSHPHSAQLEVEDPLLQPRRLTSGWRAFVTLTVVISAGAGGAIGASVARLGCETCRLVTLVWGGTLGAVFSGLGMAVLAVLIARSFEEWSRKERNEEVSKEEKKQKGAEDAAGA